MRFAIGLPGPRDPSELTGIDSLIETAQAVEKAGLDACAVTDHPFPVVDATQTGHDAFDPFVVLGCLAVTTERIRLHVSAAVLPYRNPFLVANAANTVDHASGGRLVLVVAAGYLEPEFAALGVDFAARGAMMEEGVAALKAAWTGEPVHATTPRWTAAGNRLRPTPVSRPHPPVWIAGNSRVSMERAVTSCEGWAPFGVSGERARNVRTADVGNLADLRRRIGMLRELCERHERSEPLEICLVRPPLDWGGTPSERTVREEIEELENMGVGCVSFRFQASSRSELHEKIGAWGEIAAG